MKLSRLTRNVKLTEYYLHELRKRRYSLTAAPTQVRKK
jgi:hypothetical protein